MATQQNGANQEKGLPMTSKWDPAQIQQEEAVLQGLARQPLLTRIRGYAKLTGPAWLQSAMTLGSGSAVASVVAGVSFGYELLWVQPIAMFLGVIMLAALGNVVLTTGERPYVTFWRELAPTLAILWAVGTILASVIWHFPQYGLAGAVVWDLASAVGASEDNRVLEYVVKAFAGLAILAVSIVVTWNYGSNARGIKLFETFLRWIIRLVIVSFALVLATTGVDWSALASGLFRPSIPEGGLILVLGAFGAAVGINMTFLYPYSILAKGWGKHHKGLARWDLFSSMFLPFVLVSSLIIIAMANTMFDPENPGLRHGLTAVEASQGLSGILGGYLARIVFNLGFLGMACSTIATHMVVCGFTFPEMCGLKYTTRRYRLFTLVPAIGVFGVALPSPFFLPIITSAIAFTMLPIAYIAFFLLNNKRSYIGEAVGRGWKRGVWNVLMIAAIVVACTGSATLIKTRVIDPVRNWISPIEKVEEPVPPVLPPDAVEPPADAVQEDDAPVDDTP